MKTNTEKQPYVLEQHGDIRIDNYYWIRDDSRKDPKVIAYLENENDITNKWFESKKDYQSDIVKELLEQVPDEEVTFPINNNNYKYYQKIEKEDQLPRYFFKDKDNNEVLYLNPNLKLKNQNYYSIGSIAPSPSNSFVAYTEDDNGRREYTLKIINTESLDILDDNILDISNNIVWSNDNKYIIYLKKDPITLIADSVYVHKIGTLQDEDVLIYKEYDKEFNINLYRSKTKKYAYIDIDSTNSNEIKLIDLDDPINDPITFITRSDNHLYYLEHIKNEEFIVRSNKNAPNFKILKAKSIGDDIDNFESIIEHSNDIYISDTLLVNEDLVLEVRKFGLPEITIHNLLSSESYDIKFPENAYDVSLSYNTEITNDNFNYQYSSLITPRSIFNYNLINKESTSLLSKKIVSFDKLNYKSDRFFIKARDNEQIPVVTVAHKNTVLDSAPILFYGYGSYGINIDAQFRESLIPLLNRGFIFAIVNIRGGGEMGKEWYEKGRMFNKMNTFYDFNDSVKEVLKLGIGDPKNVFAKGGSAGGLLMGAIVNLEPELYKGILSGVPFVDVLTTMSDPSIPLTTFEYDEWGNPANIDEYNYMKQYSPYDNIDKLNYPSIFITSSLFDSQVQYFEPAKYIAKLKEYNQSENVILMKMNLIGGHGGLNGKINQFKETAEEYSFILNLSNTD
ncbi:MAG: S9 family peptidase [SAR86 cluster bacterium]|uniref:S9 family peptidase n=1 Tax=SAR86 cluster bacterium TaxID=2030880 RepID=A0A520N0U8_9GAMM|nr:MAG: S9 family peptidase [SAR86 cluster bacterium]|tara:strand:- start:3150 stop:5183 length:2034 start_codon:yes stop_codon:yes gene_type:complete